MELLGEQLIRDSNIALFELVKNSYDADASRALVSAAGVNPAGLAIEVTPSCDEFRPRKIARLIAGIAIPMQKLSADHRDALRRLIRRTEATRLLPTITAPWLLGGESVDIVWAARLWFTAPVAQVARAKSKARLRHDALSDLQDWCAGHAGRPGYLMI